jgi:CheY-like chemotaxis protein
VRLGHWLNANPDGMSFLDPSEVPFGLALMVAGKRLRALGGAAEFDGDSAVCLDLPSYAPGAQSAGSGGLLVMVVEDSDESFALTRMVLEEQQVLRARDGNAALRLFERRRFDVVFMDVHMPGMDGYEAIRRMRDWETRTGSPRTPMVVLSSDDLETQQRSAAEFGCSGFLRKPLQQWDLMPLLERLK